MNQRNNLRKVKLTSKVEYCYGDKKLTGERKVFTVNPIKIAFIS